MATAARVSNISTKVVEGLTCYICYNLLREPKDLDCPHVYCLQCLQQWVKMKPTIECPECRCITIVPQGGLVNLKTNLRLKTMVDYVQDADKKSVPMCPKHAGEQQRFLCITCGIMICHDCLVLGHPRPWHKIEELKVITKAQREEMKRKMEHVQEEKERRKKEKQELSEIEDELQAAKEKANGDIKKHVQQVISEVEDKMMALVERTYQQNLGSLCTKQNHTEDIINQLQNVHSAAQNVLDVAADHNLVQQTTSLIDQMDRLRLKQQSEVPLKLVSLAFKPGSGLEDMSCFSHVHKYMMNTCKLTLLSKFSTCRFQHAKGIAATRAGLLAVVDCGKHIVSIHSKDSLTFLESNGNITMPHAVAVTSTGKFIICDAGVIKVFSPEGAYEKSWNESVFATVITTTPDDTIVIGSHKQRVITVHQSDDELIRTHKVDCGDIVDIASNGKQIAFTTADSNVRQTVFTRDSKGTICVIDFVTGQILWRVDMECPFGICYEQKLNTLLVAGGSNKPGQREIHQYSSKSGRLIYAPTVSGLYEPQAMTTTHDNQLLVADLQTVKVYQIEYEP